MADLVNRWLAKLLYSKVGVDQFGNEYYLSRADNAYGRKKRMVLYKGIAEPTKVPANWHQWLHYTSDDLPHNKHLYNWQVNHLPNRSGTSLAYIPPDTEERVEPSRGLYKAWHPKS